MRCWATLRAAGLALLVLDCAASAGALDTAAAPPASQATSGPATSQPPAAAQPEAAAVPTAGPSPVPAGEDDTNIHALGGTTRTGDQSSFALEIGFERRLNDYFSLEAVYDNEGHFTDHHRDSLGLQLFLQRRFWHQRARLRAGVGPQLYFDTQNSNNEEGNTDAHGIGLLATLAGEVDLARGFFLEARLNGSVDQNDFSSGQLLAGLGYHLGPPQPQPDSPVRSNNRILLLGGQSVRNSFASEKDFAVMAGLGRARIVSIVGADLSYLRLGSTDGRQGAALQLTAEEHFFDDWLILSGTVGPYLYVDSKGSGSSVGVAGVVGPRIGCEVAAGVEAIVTVMREFGNRDYDIILAGLSAEL